MRNRSARRAAAAGLAAAVLAEACTFSLLGLAGWFIASCAVAGVITGSTFSYLGPSGGVRSLALGRIASGWGARVLLHRSALRRRTVLRSENFRVAVDAAAHHVAPARSVERLLADTDAVAERLPRVTAPRLSIGSCIIASAVLMSTVRPVGAALLLLGCLLTAAASAWNTRIEPATGREALQAGVIEAVQSWPELVSLGAAAELRERISDRCEVIGRESIVAGPLSSAFVAAGVGATVIAVLAALLSPTAVTAPEAALFALLTVLSVEGAVAVGQTASPARRAACGRRRLAALESKPRPSVAGPIPLSGIHRVGPLCIASGNTVIVEGASGSGKTTLLKQWAADVQGARAVYVPVDDHLFAGTVLHNLKIGDATLSHDAAERLLALVELDRTLAPATLIGEGGRPLSGGEGRRVALARALAARPDVLLLDEPGAGLPVEQRRRLLHTVRRALPDAALVLAQHAADAPFAFDTIAARELRAPKT